MKAPNKIAGKIRTFFVFIMIAAIAFPLSPAQAEAVSNEARQAVDSTLQFIRGEWNSFINSASLALMPQNNGGYNPQDRASSVIGFASCPQKVILYAGEQFKVCPLALNSTGGCVHGVVCDWQTQNGSIAYVAYDGTVTAMQTGQTSVSATVGNASTDITVEVRAGLRPKLTNAQWDTDHAQDCSGTTSAPLVVDPEDPANKPDAAKSFNATGHPRFLPNAVAQASSAGTDDLPGSSNFSMGAPIFGAPGRGVGVGIALVYNSRMWTKNSNTMTFDYDQGWPAPGFRLNYGRLILNYDVAPGGFGNHLLVQPDGTRIQLASQGSNKYISTDGQHIELDTTTVPYELTYADGTVVKYNQINNKWLPNSVEDVNSNSITITYVDHNSCSSVRRVQSCTCGSGGTCSKPSRQAIDRITDTLGRHYLFYYNADGSLAEVQVPSYNNGSFDRVVAKFYYQPVTLSHNFGSMQVEGVPSGGQISALRRVYFPDTGRGYVFDEYSGYGMCTRVSMRLGMTNSLEGTETAYTRYVYQTSGQLSDAPKFAQREEWWQGKTTADGLSDSSPSIFTYGRTTDSVAKTMTNTITSMTDSVRSEMIANDDSQSVEFGLLKTHRVVDAGTNAVLFEQNYEYSNSASQSGLQRSKVFTIPDNVTANETRADMIYGTYGRMMEQVELGFRINGAFKKRRRTVYSYFDNNGDPSYLDKGLLHLVKEVKVYDAKETDSNTDDVLIARTRFQYDQNSDPNWRRLHE